MKISITHFFYVTMFCLSAQMLTAMEAKQRAGARRDSVALAQAYPDGFRVTGDLTAFTRRIEEEAVQDRPWSERHPIKCAVCAACTTVISIAAGMAALAAVTPTFRI
jgi:hypothetical protein